MHPEIMRLIVNERMAQLHRDAKPRAPRPERPALDEASVALRLCRVDDDPALEDLAALAERPLPTGRFVVGEVDGRIVAALPLTGGPPLADPFVRTEHLLPLLELRAAQVRGDRSRFRAVPRLRPRRA